MGNEEPRHIAGLADYNEWLWSLGPERVQELLDTKETRTIKLPDGTVFEFVVDGLLAAWGQHCKEQGWKDEAFTESNERAKAELLAALDREDQEWTDEEVAEFWKEAQSYWRGERDEQDKEHSET